MKKLAVYNLQGKETETIELPETIFKDRINQGVIHQAVVMYQAGLRQGNASTKERGAVSGGGRKPFRQKGTGRARAGSIRSPLWRKGGVVFGPHPRDFSYTIPKKIRKAALRESLNAKYISKNICCIDPIKDKLSKTKEFAKILSNLKLGGKILALLDDSDSSVRLVSRYIPYFDIMRSSDVNAYDVMRCRNVLMTTAALKTLLKRLD